MLFLLQAAVVFTATAAADFAWTKYMLHVAAKRPHWSAVWSAAIIGLGAISVYSYAHDPWLILPALLGAYCGTYLAVTRDLTDTSQLDKCKCTPLGKAQCWEPCGDLGKSAEHARVAPCDHKRCTVSESDGDLLRWSCGRIEG